MYTGMHKGNQVQDFQQESISLLTKRWSNKGGLALNKMMCIKLLPIHQTESIWNIFQEHINLHSLLMPVQLYRT